MKNIFSIDVEEWYQTNFQTKDTTVINKNISNVEKGVDIILELLKKTNNYGTFFILGEVAGKHKKMVRRIRKEGHEIASHSYNHNLVYNMSEKDFKHQARKSKELLEDITGQQIKGYRAPSWSVDYKRTPWFWKTLYKLGYKYSSSIMPFKTYLYGDSSAPRFVHKKDKLYELPPSTITLFKKRIPFSGGLYLRALPTKLLLMAANSLNKEKNEVIFYVHPREVDTNQPKLKLNFKDRLIHNWGLRSTEKKLEAILTNYDCTSFDRYLKV